MNTYLIKKTNKQRNDVVPLLNLWQGIISLKHLHFHVYTRIKCLAFSSNRKLEPEVPFTSVFITNIRIFLVLNF